MPAIAVLEGGPAIVVWRSQEGDSKGTGLRGRHLLADGSAPSGDEFQVNEKPEGNQQTPDVAALTDGGYIVVWHDGTS